MKQKRIKGEADWRAEPAAKSANTNLKW